MGVRWVGIYVYDNSFGIPLGAIFVVLGRYYELKLGEKVKRV